MDGARWLHVSGVTPALGEDSAAAAIGAVNAAKAAAGVPVSFDGNYRAKLWAERSGQAPAILRELIAGADLAFVDDRDLAMVLGRGFDTPDPAARRRAAADAAFAAFPRLTRIASTLRTQHAADRHDLSGFMFTRVGAALATEVFALNGIVDRIGSGDAFASGLLHGLFNGMSERRGTDLRRRFGLHGETRRFRRFQAYRASATSRGSSPKRGSRRSSLRAGAMAEVHSNGRGPPQELFAL